MNIQPKMDKQIAILLVFNKKNKKNQAVNVYPCTFSTFHFVTTSTEYLLYSSWDGHTQWVIFNTIYKILSQFARNRRKKWARMNHWEMQESRERAGSGGTQWLHNLRYWPVNLWSCRAIKFGLALTAYIMWHFWQIQSTSTALPSSLVCTGLSQCMCICMCVCVRTCSQLYKNVQAHTTRNFTVTTLIKDKMTTWLPQRARKSSIKFSLWN